MNGEAWYCPWCGHVIERRAHRPRNGGALTIGRVCAEGCEACGAYLRTAWVRRALAADLPPKVYR